MPEQEELAYRLGYQTGQSNETALQEAYSAGYYDAKAENLWRYPSRGELPGIDGFYLVTVVNPVTRERRATVGLYRDRFVDTDATAWDYVIAWRELPEPAPELGNKLEEV